MRGTRGIGVSDLGAGLSVAGGPGLKAQAAGGVVETMLNAAAARIAWSIGG